MPQSESIKAPDASTVIDFMALLGRCLGSFKMVERVLAAFRDAGASDLSQLRLAIETDDFPVVIEISHRFKGAAGNVSATRLHKLLGQMEECGRENDTTRLPEILDQIEAEWIGFKRFAQVFAPGGTPSSQLSLDCIRSELESRHARIGC